MDRLSPFGIEPFDRNIALADEQSLTSLMGLWQLFETIHEQVTKLHAAGLAHGDLFLHNIIIPASPIGVFLIDFELAVDKNKATEEAWEKACFSDFEEIYRCATYIQCSLGKQTSPLAEATLARLNELFGSTAERFQKAIDRHSFL